MNETSVAQALLTKAFPPSTAAKIFTDKIHRKHLYILAAPGPDNRELRRKERLKNRKQTQRATSRKPKPLTAREKRVLGIHEIPHEAVKYEIYEPLHRLWIGYMQEILNIGAGGGNGVGAGQAQIGLKLASADYHGALFDIVRSRCPSRVGIKGICVKETKRMFYIITKGDKMKEIPKEHSVFRFELPVEELSPRSPDGVPKPKSMVFELHGSQCMYRAAERAGRKFKYKPLTDL